uniref:DUF4216 domain-containing protein n=1 Tax=Brassica oleracea var. oleracea TaxID=109376 RepID=A0A0D3BGN9_BRAOL
MSSGVYYRSWMDKPHMDPNTNLLTEEYVQGIGEFTKLVEQKSDAKTDRGVKTDGFGVTLVHSRRKLQYYDPFILASQADQRTKLRLGSLMKILMILIRNSYYLTCPRKHAIPHPVVLHPVVAEVVQRTVPVHRDHLTNKTRFPHMFQLPLQLHMFPLQLLWRIRGSCQFNNWFNNQVESFSWFSIPTHDRDIQLVSTSRAMALAGELWEPKFTLSISVK